MRQTRSERWVLGLVVAGLLVGGALFLAGRGELARICFAATIVVALVPLGWSVARELLAGRAGVDLIALLAMAGALALGEFLAGAVVALMLAGGQVLEGYADTRARRELSALVERTPRFVHRYEEGGVVDRPLAEVRLGDRLLVKPGQVVPVDGSVLGEVAVLDESALTGEARPVERRQGERVASGVVNAGGPFDLRATTTADESTYAGIVRLVEAAQASKAPLVRLADRYALFFLPLTLAIAAGAWAFSGEAVRALAVLVVATPCPLLLAAPVAIVGGISAAARRGVIVKGGGALETLARSRILFLDKTGTVTAGRPVVREVRTFSDWEAADVLRWAASLDQTSPHVLADAIVQEARRTGLDLVFPSAVSEQLGAGIEGLVEGRRVALGKSDWLAERAPLPHAARELRRRSRLEGSSTVFVAVDGAFAGAIVLEDPIRIDAPRTIRHLKRVGFEEVVLLTGDRPDLAESVGVAVGADRVLAERSPRDKVEAVRAATGEGPTVMVGDGINDAPALAAADVGVALGARGATASSEAADAVLIVDQLDRLADAVTVARRSRDIALESILVGMGLSIAAMGVAAAGYLAPIAGALLQEAIDVAVILNALRALGAGRRRHLEPADVEAGRQVAHEHRRLMPEVQRLREVADRLDELEPAVLLAELARVRHFLTAELLPHEQREDQAVYPVVARLVGGEDPTATMSRAHLEIAHLIRVFDRLLEELPAEGPAPEDLRELRRVLYGLYAILRLHFAQEEESYLRILGADAQRTEEPQATGAAS